MLRRTFLKGAAAAALAFLKPGAVLASVWNKAAFSAKSRFEAMLDSGYNDAEESGDILIKAPEIAEDGAMVPVEVTSNIPGTTSMAFFAEKNPNPLVADFSFSDGALPYISTHIKMAETSVFRVAVKANGKVYTAGREIKVTIGGCGG